MAEGKRQDGAWVVEAPVVLEMRDITKTFGPVKANDNISLRLRRGEILGLLGENGAGKSTLMKILYGLYRPDSGTVVVDGEPVQVRDPKDAVSRGIGMVHQHFTLIPPLTVAENIVLGAEPRRGGSLDMAPRSTRARGSRTSPWACSSGSRSSKPSTATPASSSSTSRRRS
jgi:simple sugar transport system ATP-binding protein